MRQYPLDPAHYRGDPPASIAAQHTHVDDVRFGSDADELTVRTTTVPGDDPCDMRSVAARVAYKPLIRKVDRREKAICRFDQVRISRNTGVEYRHGHASTGRSLCPGLIGIDDVRVDR